MINELLQLYEEMDKVIQDSIRVGVTPELIERSESIWKKIEELRKNYHPRDAEESLQESLQVIKVSRRIQDKVKERISELRS